MQNLFFFVFGPSSKTCPRCALHFEQVTSVRTIFGFVISRSRFPPTMRRGDTTQQEYENRTGKKQKKNYYFNTKSILYH